MDVVLTGSWTKKAAVGLVGMLIVLACHGQVSVPGASFTEKSETSSRMPIVDQGIPDIEPPKGTDTSVLLRKMVAQLQQENADLKKAVAGLRVQNTELAKSAKMLAQASNILNEKILSLYPDPEEKEAARQQLDEVKKTSPIEAFDLSFRAYVSRVERLLSADSSPAPPAH